MAPPELPAARHPLYGLRALLPPALLFFYYFAVESLGFIATAAIVALALSRALGAGWRIALPLALIAPPLLHLAFFKLLRVPLPAGLLPMPW
jgi:putative tricarboxylic transport membrane protein